MRKLDSCLHKEPQNYCRAEDFALSPFTPEGEGLYGRIEGKEPGGTLAFCRCRLLDREMAEYLSGCAGMDAVSVEFIRQADGDWVAAIHSDRILDARYGRLTAGEMDKLLADLA